MISRRPNSHRANGKVRAAHSTVPVSSVHILYLSQTRSPLTSRSTSTGASAPTLPRHRVEQCRRTDAAIRDGEDQDAQLAITPAARMTH